MWFEPFKFMMELGGKLMHVAAVVWKLKFVRVRVLVEPFHSKPWPLWDVPATKFKVVPVLRNAWAG